MRSSQTCVKKDGCEMYNLIDQNVSEARAGLTQTLRRMTGGEKIVLIVRKRHGEPQAVLIPPPEAPRYFEWRADQNLILAHTRRTLRLSSLNLLQETSKLAPSYRDLETKRGSVASVNLGEPDSDET